jgi:hypothetical protein
VSDGSSASPWKKGTGALGSRILLQKETLAVSHARANEGRHAELSLDLVVLLGQGIDGNQVSSGPGQTLPSIVSGLAPTSRKVPPSGTLTWVAEVLLELVVRSMRQPFLSPQILVSNHRFQKSVSTWRIQRFQ